MIQELPIHISLRVEIVDPLGDNSWEVELPYNMPMNQLVPQLLPKFGISHQGNLWLQHMRTELILGSNETLRSTGVKAHDALRIVQSAAAGGGIPIRSFQDIQLIDTALRQQELLRGLDGIVLFAVILYTNEDSKLVAYIHEHFSDLHFMSGSCMFFVIEQPQPDLTVNIQSYLEQLTPETGGNVLKQLETVTYRPYDRSRAYEIAERFSVLPQQFPCIVFFSDLTSRRRLVIELGQFTSKGEDAKISYSGVFRMLFSQATQTMDYEIDYRLDELSKMLKAEQMKHGIRSFAKGVTLSAIGASFIEILRTLI